MRVRMEYGHHQSVAVTYQKKLEWWNNETLGDPVLRCRNCWLRSYDCFCLELKKKSKSYCEFFDQSASNFNLEIVLYYHFLELGRSANTAHVFQQLCPSITTQLVYGDTASEEALFSKIKMEYENKTGYTCILYLCNESLGLGDWISKNFNRDNFSQSSSNTTSSKILRLVILDGTYPCASRMAKYLMTCREHFSLNKDSLPFVKLDLPEDGFRSAVAGIMYQPAKQKLCSFQATSLALSQILNISSIYENQYKDLESWIAYILQRKIKYGKLQPRHSLSQVDNTPAQYAREIMESLPMHIYLKRNPAPKKVQHKPKICLLPTKKFSIFHLSWH